MVLYANVQNFRTEAWYTLKRLENDAVHFAQNENETDDLEAKFLMNIESAKHELSKGIDGVEQAVINKRPHQNDPNYDIKRIRYEELLRMSLTGIKTLRSGLVKIFNRLKEIVANIKQWIVYRVRGIANRIRNAFKGLINFLF